MHKLALLLAAGWAAAAQTKADPERVARLLQRAVMIDLHDDTTQMIVDEGYNLAEKHDYGQVDIPRMRAGHVSGLFFSIWTDTDRYTPQNRSAARCSRSTACAAGDRTASQ